MPVCPFLCVPGRGEALPSLCTPNKRFEKHAFKAAVLVFFADEPCQPRKIGYALEEFRRRRILGDIRVSSREEWKRHILEKFLEGQVNEFRMNSRLVDCPIGGESVETQIIKCLSILVGEEA
mmetsp:Transcript_20173/g.30335  ORF Transcript_20173/g.30335 Transcript_20173/m.30335 type:complete len:122 (+) Transcript_20173:478-843(+)|eukprot:CAMPEP_0178936612 /NCGR_PEP_ID=MMETSP0786-20121207/25277_1 /TAXON_ID=186022 /ORGANISM="Thalassionema frauenfeldii, Strain CCMP 1798" /LENGTH=121 /DNA_ID=CAMNT_0020615049 /DNA_START=265 /DNA_END=630 /DNA_ORIENTATION=+